MPLFVNLLWVLMFGVLCVVPVQLNDCSLFLVALNCLITSCLA